MNRDLMTEGGDAALRALVEQWRVEASLGSTYERGKGRDEALNHCADELAALVPERASEVPTVSLEARIQTKVGIWRSCLDARRRGSMSPVELLNEFGAMLDEFEALVGGTAHPPEEPAQPHADAAQGGVTRDAAGNLVYAHVPVVEEATHEHRSPDGDGPAQSTEHSGIALQGAPDTRGDWQGNAAAQHVPCHDQAGSNPADVHQHTTDAAPGGVSRVGETLAYTHVLVVEEAHCQMCDAVVTWNKITCWYCCHECGHHNGTARLREAAGGTAHPEPALRGWQPIATAPNGELVIVWLPNYGCVTANRTDRDWWARVSSEIVYPTHWMPLPDPPAADAPEGEDS